MFKKVATTFEHIYKIFDIILHNKFKRQFQYEKRAIILQFIVEFYTTPKHLEV